MHSGYLRTIFDSTVQLHKAISAAKKIFKKSTVEFDAIAVTGVSGTTFGSILAYTLKKQLIVVRKRTEKTHGNYICEGTPNENYKYIIVDDFISSGATIFNIIQEIEWSKQDGFVGEFVGSYLYQYDGGRQKYFDVDDTLGQCYAEQRKKIRNIIDLNVVMA